MAERILKFGVIGGGLMGKEFASAAARWLHLSEARARPVIVAICDPNSAARAWFTEKVPTVSRAYEDYRDLLADPDIDAVYCAVPHDQHAALYIDVIRSGKHLLGEKPFGIDLAANAAINEAIAAHPRVVVRCSSELPFFPGGIAVARLAASGAIGRVIEVESGLWHSSDLNPEKPINWKRRVDTCGEYGVLGDLGMHAMHLPLRLGWKPRNVRAVLTKIVDRRPDGKGGTSECETWDNGTLLCSAHDASGAEFPLTISTKRIAPGHQNTWFFNVIGTKLSVRYSTQYPKQLLTLPYAQPGDVQSWHHTDAGYESAYKTITGGIFEFGFSDAILQMWAAFCDEVAHGREGMQQPFHCATPDEAAATHKVFTAALSSQQEQSTVSLRD